MTAMAAESPTPLPLSLRERKKLRTRAAIRRATYRLVAEQGYDASTVEQIAAAAEVSPSTVVRYFPVKEDILLTDENDALLAARLRARPADEEPLESLRAVVLEAVTSALADEPEETRLRARLMAEIPAVRARLTETTAETAQLLAHTIAERTGRDTDDLEVRVFTAAVLGALREATVYWAERGQSDDLIPLLDRTLDTLKGGLSLRALP
ncbi:TetR family transcriptional regulator [Streptomyces sp. ISL-36]|uniref:acyl-CoA-like ligand-binding transcription factor n=1 Tax=Streptomyces sp. ISL-36 TaxID=2819182 RepID=UPI001BE86C9A|nr:TetR family transcriptional regulator [Streptomyces sp. ISL-36]MBT2439429.1 TetR family transcriptional regulator [Streptomyces sp. ISL-36]